MNLVDSSGWIEYFFEGANVSFFSSVIEKTTDLIVPVICMYEVFKKINIAADEAYALQAVAQMKQGHILDLTENVALSAALLSLNHKLPMADSLIYATARAYDAVLWTQDEHFKELPNVKYQAARTKVSNRRSKGR